MSYTGVLFEDLLYLDTKNALVPSRTVYEKGVYGPDLEYLAGAGTDHSRTFPNQAFQGVVPENYADIYYNNIFVKPTDFERSLLTSTEVLDALIWNAYLSTTVVLSTITKKDTSGTELTITAPQTLGPMQEVTGTFTALASGPVSQDGGYTFIFDSGDTVFLKVVIKRIIALPFIHNWNDSLSMSLVFNTVIASNKKLYEYRTGLCSKPSRSIDCSFLETGISAARLRVLLQGSSNRTFAVPIAQEPFYVTVDSSGQSLTADRDISPYWNLNNFCSSIIGVLGEGNGVIRSIESIDLETNTITVTTALDTDTDYSKVPFFPAFYGVVTKNTCTNVTAFTTKAELTLEEYTGSTQPAIEDQGDLPSFFPMSLDYETAPSSTPKLSRNLVAYNGTGELIYTFVNRDPQNFDVQVAGTDVSSIIAHFCQALGRLKRFFFVEPSPITFLSKSALSGAALLTCAYTGWSPQNVGYEQIGYYDSTGTFKSFVLDAITAEDSSGNVSLTLASGIEDDLALDTPLYRVLVVRYDIDTLKLTFPCSGYTRSTLRVFELVQEIEE